MLFEEPIGQLPDGRYAQYVQLKAKDVDLDNHWKLASVFETFQEIAGEQCTGLGFGWKELTTRYGFCFVIVRMHVEMDAYPGSGEVVRVETWPENKLRMIFTRYFRIIDKQDRVIGRAVSQWALFDMGRRCVVKPQQCPILQMPDTSSLQPPATMPKHGGKQDESAGNAYVLERMPVYSDFDYNRHVNNARYIEWVRDALPAETYVKTVSSLDIHYEHELDYETFSSCAEAQRKLTLLCNVEEKAIFAVKGLRVDGTPCFTCTGRFA